VERSAKVLKVKSLDPLHKTKPLPLLSQQSTVPLGLPTELSLQTSRLGREDIEKFKETIYMRHLLLQTIAE
jgi:hypothetical protein